MDWKTRDKFLQLLSAVDIYFNGLWMRGRVEEGSIETFSRMCREPEETEDLLIVPLRYPGQTIHTTLFL